MAEIKRMRKILMLITPVRGLVNKTCPQTRYANYGYRVRARVRARIKAIGLLGLGLTLIALIALNLTLTLIALIALSYILKFAYFVCGHVLFTNPVRGKI